MANTTEDTVQAEHFVRATTAPSTSAVPDGIATNPRAARRFQRELRSIMYGFGDARQPQEESVQLLEDMVVDYIHQLLQKAQIACEHRMRGMRKSTEPKLRDRDLLFVLRKDKRKYERVVEILEVWKELKTARGTTSNTKELGTLDFGDE